MKITLTLIDDDEPDREYTVIVYGDKIGGAPAQPTAREEVETNGKKDILINLPVDDLDYVFLKIVQHDEDEKDDTAWTAPIWLK